MHDAPAPLEGIQALRDDPALAKLLGILRSDNAVLGLAVEQRELSWTQCLAWLMNPLAHEGRASAFAAALLASLGEPRPGPVQVTRAEAEVPYGDGTRLDLRVDLSCAGVRVRVLVENKIESAEREDQLRGYLEHDRREDPTLERRALLIDLKDDAATTSTEPTATVWSREHVRRWLESGVAECGRRGAPVPRLVADWLGVFEARDVARSLRERHLVLRQLAPSAEVVGVPEWPLLQKWLRADDAPFFRRVLAKAQPMLDGFKGDVYGTMLGRNAGLVVWRPRWRRRPPGGPEGRAVEVHVEVRRLDRVEVHVEAYPYRGSADARPGGDTRGLLDERKRVLRALRERLQRVDGADPRGLRDMGSDSTLQAMKFALHPVPADGDHAALARALVEVVDRVAPVIEAVLAEVAAGWAEVGD